MNTSQGETSPKAPNLPTGTPGDEDSPRRKNVLRDFASTSLSRFIGYGLLILFLMDVVEVLIGYRPFVPQSDATLVSQLIERIAVPLMAYALIFAAEPNNPGRFERGARKFISFGSLLMMAICLLLTGLALYAGQRLSRQSGAYFQQQIVERNAVLTRLKTEMPKFNDAQVTLAYRELILRPQGLAVSTAISTAEMREKTLASIPLELEKTVSSVNSARKEARNQLLITTTKYSLGGIIAAAMFLFAWEASYPARAARVFRYRTGPSLGMEDKMASWFDRVMAWASEFSPLPNFEDFRWFRRLRRAWRHWKDSRRS